MGTGKRKARRIGKREGRGRGGGGEEEGGRAKYNDDMCVKMPQ